jgi:hypothetical protein
MSCSSFSRTSDTTTHIYIYTHKTTRVAARTAGSQSDAAWRPTAAPSLRTARHTRPATEVGASAVVERAHAELLARLGERRAALADHRRVT